MFIKRRKKVISIIRSPTQLSISQREMYNKIRPRVKPLKMFGSVKSKITLNTNQIKKIPPISRLPITIQLYQNVPWMARSKQDIYGIDFISSCQTGISVKIK